MGKKRKSQDNTDSIDANKKKKGKTTKDGIPKDVIIVVNQNNDTEVNSGISKKRKDKKAKKLIADDVIENVNEDRETGAQSNNKKNKVKKPEGKITEDVENQDSEISVQVSSKKRKSKKLKDGPSKGKIKNVNEDSENAVQSTINKRAISNSGTPKKIIFVDDEPQEVTSNNKTNKSKHFKKIKEHSSDLLKEEDVKDEDIDKFCDELGEDDNKQYENWVQLIEASLSCNKKKPK